MARDFLRKPIVYLEKPTSKDEQEIAYLIEQAMAALSSENPDRITSLYFSDATMTLPFGNKMEPITPNEYAEKLKKIAWPIGRFSFIDVVIRVRTETSASVFGTFLFTPRTNYREQASSRIFLCAKRDGLWKFISSHNL